MLYKQSEWVSPTGQWHCNCVDNLGQGSGYWWHPARILGTSPAQFLSLLFEKFEPDHFYINKKTCFCSWSWDKQDKMRLYKNYINKVAREKNYQI